MLARFFEETTPLAREKWRAPFEAAVSEVVTAVLEHTRPQQVHVTLAIDADTLVATVRESGQWWQGEPAPENLLDTLPQADPLPFDDARHQSDGAGHSWSLRRRIGGTPQPPPPPRSRLLRAELSELASATARLAEEPAAVQLPHLDRDDEVGDLARGLRSLQELLVERDTLIERSPVAISWLTADLRWKDVNRAFLIQHGHSSKEQLIGRSMLEQVDPVVLERARHWFLAATGTERDLFRWHNRYRRADGTIGWLEINSVPLRDRDGAVSGWVAFTVDDTARVALEHDTAALQQQMFPGGPPLLEGYDLAGRCLPADLMMSGDFYDWRLSPDGRLDLTVADVMGKGPAAALSMAALRTSLRAAEGSLGPADRLDRATSAMTSLAATRFITVFDARVDLTTGVFRYVDAGHGHWVIRRLGAGLVRPGGRSLPMFVAPEERFEEAEARLLPGDALIVYSDGLVEAGDRTLALDDFARDLAGAEDAETMVRSLLGHLPAFLPDDATVVVLRRLT